jgi:hypothetical protein
MCSGCWVEAGSPCINTLQVRYAAECKNRLYEHPRGCVGAALHIFTDDWNVDDSSLRFCGTHIGRIEREAKEDPTNGPEDLARYAELTELEQACFDAFMPLTEDERVSALALGRFWDTP